MSEQPTEPRGGTGTPADAYAELDAALERVVAAARKHLAAVKQADGRVDDEAVWRSYVELNNATFAYDDLMLETCGEVTPWDVERIDPEEAEDQWVDSSLEEAADEPPMTISVRQRRDYEVPSVRALLRVASAVRRDASRAEASTSRHDTDRAVTDVGDAVVELMRAGDGTLGSLDIPELEPLSTVVTVSVTDTPLDVEKLDDSTPDAGFHSGKDDRLVRRYVAKEPELDIEESDGAASPDA